MTDEAPLSGNERALVIAVLVVGGLVSLFGLMTFTSTLYTLKTGKVAGSDLSRMFTSGAKDQKLNELMDRQQVLQVEAQKRFAPALLGTEGAYLAAWAAMMAVAISLLRDRGGRKRLAMLAVGAAVVRVAVGIVSYLLTVALTQGTTDAVMSGMNQPGQGGLSPESAERMQRGMGAMMTAITAAGAACTAFIICGFLLVVAIVFWRGPKPPATVPPAPAAG